MVGVSDVKEKKLSLDRVAKFFSTYSSLAKTSFDARRAILKEAMAVAFPDYPTYIQVCEFV